MTRLNKDEFAQYGNLIDSLGFGLDPQMAFQIYTGLVQEAQTRQVANQQALTQGVSGLQDLATQLAASGANQQSIAGLVGSEFSNLPLSGTPRGQEALGGLTSLIASAFPGGGGPNQVSGLASPDLRAAATSGQFDAQSRLQVYQALKGMIAKAPQDPTNNNVIAARQTFQSLLGPDLAPDQQQALDQFVTDTWYNLGGPGPGQYGQDLGAAAPSRYPNVPTAPTPTATAPYQPTDVQHIFGQGFAGRYGR